MFAVPFTNATKAELWKKLKLLWLVEAFDELKPSSIKGCIHKADRQLERLAQYIKDQEDKTTTTATAMSVAITVMTPVASASD
ncbi:hypothetical protein H310_14993 [Aphanomyces invadans]|uniref:Uncharacterized protein n=1 Tax=Aphanomyces invadans TaxID=157072 RepID=A0A024T9Z2_9STRA|nr:hypothetical protein H310_14993 [Aphanomyces invadans]ETV90177.1 hypothetical protein H310_14993 [Aphanomyces invadans]|eukprot:XP_008881192.1 hypothetical protein H310_14993 [Aphanomyces invadans]